MATDAAASFSEVLKELRNRKKLSRAKLAQQLHMHPSSIEKWERGDVLPDRARVEDLIRALQLSEAERLLLLEAHAGLRVLPSLHNVPSAQNPYFTGREEVLAQMHDQLAPGGQVALTQAISGLGGIGKTQVALHYVYRFQKAYSHVLWVTADSPTLLITEFVRLARDLELPEKDEKDQGKIVQSVQRWLREYLNWLLILDNIEDLSLISSFIPAGHLGSVLLTTRRQVTEPVAQALELDVFSESEGAFFLLKRARRLALGETLDEAEASDMVIARAITQQLGGLPLALDEAGAYIAETGCGLSDYLDLFKKRQKALLDRRGTLAYDHPRSVVATFSLAFEQVQQKNEAAIDLLKLCAYLAPDAIPLEIFTKGAAYLGTALGPVADDALQLDQAVETLLAYSLVRRNGENHMLSIHRLVQAVLQDTLAAEQHAWTERTLLAVNAAFPKVEYSTWSQCERLLPHALLTAQYIEMYQIIDEEAGRLLHEMATYLRGRARYPEAEPLYQRALRIREQRLGLEHPLVAYPLHGLAALYQKQGKYVEAEPLFQRALHIRERQLGPDHPLVASLLDDLAALSYQRGKYAEAEMLFQRALHIREWQLGPDHPDMAYSLNGLAALSYQRGKYAEAEPLYQRALRIWEQQFGPEHPLVADLLNNLANLYRDQGKYAEAEPLYQRTLRIQEQQFGPEHPLMVYPLNNLANLYLDQGKYVEAEPLYQWALRICEQQFGPEYPDVAYPLAGLADLCYRQGKYAEAEPLYQRALALYEKVLGPEHPDVASLLHGLAELYREQGKYAKAESLYQRTLRIREQALGAQHPETAETMHSLALLWEASGSSEEARALYARALTIREQALGAQHLKTMETRKHIIALLHTLGQHEEAAQLEAVKTEQGMSEEERKADTEG